MRGRRITAKFEALWPLVALVGATTAWGSTFVVNRVVLEQVGVFAILAVRFPLALAILLPVAFKAGGLCVSRLIDARLILPGVVLGAHFALQTAGLVYTTASRGALIVAGVPIVTAAAAASMLKERIDRHLMAGIALSIVGVGVLMGVPGRGSAAGMLAGDLLVVASVVAWAIYTVQVRHLTTTHSTLEITLTATAAAAVLMVVGGVIEWHAMGPAIVSGREIVMLVYLGIVPSAAAFLAWNWALRNVEASRAAPFVNLVPVTGVALALTVGETLVASELVGGAVVAVGLWLAYRRTSSG